MKPVTGKSSYQQFKPHWMVVLGFLAVILVGTVLLSLPVASANASRLSLLTALFTATSATCITGLMVVDVGRDLSVFGQMVILALIQIGGLGIMTLGTFLLAIAGRRFSVRSEFVLLNAYGVAKSHNLRTLLFGALGLTLFFESIGTVLLWWRYQALTTIPEGAAWYYAAFHAVSSFCNAGIALHADSLVGWAQDPVFLLVVSFLVIVGGLGFLVLYNLLTFRFWQRNLKKRGRLSLHTRVVLTATAILLLVGFVFVLSQEWSGALADLAPRHKIVCAFFQSVAPRSVGFTAVPMELLSDASRFVTMLLMLIGGSPGSAAGGIKITTLVVLVMTMRALYRNRSETVIFERTVPFRVVREALVIFLLTLAFLLLTYGVLLILESPLQGDQAARLFFEAISAIGTVGLSVDYTAALSNWGRCVIIVSMFLGRIGPLTVTLMIGRRGETYLVRYPEEEIVVG